MTNHADPEAAHYSIADLAADAAVVRRALRLGGTTVKLPDQHPIVLPDDVITDRALALVAGLDSYGD